jgi:hypothetical protein
MGTPLAMAPTPDLGTVLVDAEFCTLGRRLADGTSGTGAR